jgi:biopolymer transport protein ExbB
MFNEKIFAVAHYLDQGVLYLLVLMSIFSIGLILERYFFLKKVFADSQKIRSRMRAALNMNSLDDVEGLARDVDTLEGRAVACGLRHHKDHGTKGLEEVFNTFSLSERPDLERSLNVLATIGSNAPYIGLFGTVLGIMKAFQDLASSTEAGQQTVMAGISQALVATAAGLFVAIPATMAYNYYQKRVRSIMTNLEAVKELCLAYSKQKEG